MAESTPSPKKRGEVDTSRPYADVKEAISRFDHLPGVRNSAEKRGYESPVAALKEQLAEAMAAKSRAESAKAEIEQELVKLKKSYEQLGQKLDMVLTTTPLIPSDELHKLYDAAMADLESSRNRIQELEAGGGAAEADADHRVDEEKVATIDSLSKELDDARDREKESMHRVEKLASQLKDLVEELRRANEELGRLKSSGLRAMAAVGETAAETTRIEAAIKDVEGEKFALLATKRYLEPELESTKLEQEALQRDEDGDEEDHVAAVEKIKSKIEAAKSSESKTEENVAAMMDGFEQVAAEAMEAEVVRAGVVGEVVRMRGEVAEIKAATRASEQRIGELYEAARVAKESEARAMESIRKLGDDRVDEETVVEEETKRRLNEAREEEAATRRREEELRKNLEVARAEIEATRMDLKHANDKTASAEAAKAAVEGELRRWRSENEQRRRMAMVSNLTAATPVPQRNGDAVTMVASVSSMDHRPDGNGNGRRFSASSRDHGNELVLPPRFESHGRRSSGESLAQVLQMKLPDPVAAAAAAAVAAAKSKSQDQLVVESIEIKKKKMKLLARLGAIFTARKKRT